MSEYAETAHIQKKYTTRRQAIVLYSAALCNALSWKDIKRSEQYDVQKPIIVQNTICDGNKPFTRWCT